MNKILSHRILRCLMIFILITCPVFMYGQSGAIVSLAPIDGLEIKPDNIFNFQVQSLSSHTYNAFIKGTIHYRNSDMTISYSFNYTLRPGVNMIDRNLVHPQWQFSNNSLRQLFFNYKILPTGTYQYCVNVVLGNGQNGDNANIQDNSEDCIYHRTQDMFLINLIDPENNAKIHEDNPLLTWVVNYPFANELTYRIRVAPIQNGQNAANAIARNNPVFDERNLMQNSIVYPAYAKPLIHNQPYAWTVDAYYGGILLGSAEKWIFTIIDDTPFTAIPYSMSYIDIKREEGKTDLYAVGNIKLKYVLDNYKIDTLSLHIYNQSGKEISMKGNRLPAVYGDNRYDLDLADSCNLKHADTYNMVINSQYGQVYKLKFEYINPDFNH